jgi:flagellar assembly factor FliW
MVEYDYVVPGFGKTAQAALKDAKSNLPYAVKASDRYAQIVIGDPIAIEGQYKVEIKYNLRQQNKEPNKKRSSSAGPTNPLEHASIDNLV